MALDTCLINQSYQTFNLIFFSALFKSYLVFQRYTYLNLTANQLVRLVLLRTAFKT